MKVFAILASCCLGMMSYGLVIQKVSFDKIAYGISAETVMELGQKYGVQGCGLGLGAPDGKVKSMSINLRINRKLTLAEARKLLMKCVEEYLQKINGNVEIDRILKNSVSNK